MTRRLLPLLLCCAAACTADDAPYPEHAAYKPMPPAALSCVPNLDGKIDAAELRAGLGVVARYLVSTAPRTVDVAGKQFTSGTHWSFTGDYADDRVVEIGPSKPEGTWFAASFPGATFTAPFDAGATTIAIYAATDSSIQLLGLASAEENPKEGKTLLIYETPIDAYRFPLQPGASWVSASLVKNATLRGLPYFGKDTYEIAVDGSGILDLPDLELSQAIRVRTKVTVQPDAGPAVVQRQAQFLFECFGEVARATSQNGEQNDDFTTAAEVRRLGF